jgi:hypothetical protein
MLLRSRPKSSLTESASSASSEVDLPRYSQRELRAKPCWGRVDVGPSLGGGPKTYGLCQRTLPHRLNQCVRTGNTTGIPPLTAFVPVKSAFSLTHRFSVLPLLLFQLVTVAPKSSTSMLSPEGSAATTFWLPPSPTMSIWAVGPEAVGALSAEGRLARSTIVICGSNAMWLEGGELS